MVIPLLYLSYAIRGRHGVFSLTPVLHFRHRSSAADRPLMLLTVGAYWCGLYLWLDRVGFARSQRIIDGHFFPVLLVAVRIFPSYALFEHGFDLV